MEKVIIMKIDNKKIQNEIAEYLNNIENQIDNMNGLSNQEKLDYKIKITEMKMRYLNKTLGMV